MGWGKITQMTLGALIASSKKKWKNLRHSATQKQQAKSFSVIENNYKNLLRLLKSVGFIYTFFKSHLLLTIVHAVKLKNLVLIIPQEKKCMKTAWFTCIFHWHDIHELSSAPTALWIIKKQSAVIN